MYHRNSIATDRKHLLPPGSRLVGLIRLIVDRGVDCAPVLKCSARSYSFVQVLQYRLTNKIYADFKQEWSLVVIIYIMVILIFEKIMFLSYY